MAEKFIQKMHLKKGALHKQLGIPIGKKIPEATLEKAAHAPGKLGRRARVAETLKGLHGGSKSKAPHAGKHDGSMLGEPNVERHRGPHHNVRNPKTHHHKLRHE